MKNTLLLFSTVLLFFCKPNKIIAQKSLESSQKHSILALGDSYTIGESVCKTCNFPEQLKAKLEENLTDSDFQLKIVAKTGWTTSDLIKAIANKKLDTHYNLVTLLIGVNNQYQNKSFSVYETEFPQLVDIAILKAGNNKDKVIVISIPDYAFTPFGNEKNTITEDINRHNAFAKSYCNEHNISFINITDITRQGIAQPNLVAKDGLHPSKLAYSKFVERLLPIALDILN